MLRMNINTTIKSGNTIVLASGTVISHNNEPIEISFPMTGEPLTIVFIFDKDDTGKTLLKANAPTTKRLELTLLNFNNSLGQGNIQPLQIGEISHKQIFLNFRVYALDEKTSKTLQFTFYQNE